MIDATLNLTSIRCNAESDFGDAEPYLWTVFFYSDMSTLSGSSGLVMVHTPHRTSTTRGMYANGIAPGDQFAIPTSMGEFDVTLDGGGLGLSLIGCLFVLIDERNTDADAIKAGHVALDEAARTALNELAATKISAVDKTPTADEVKAMATYIGGRVLAAIKDQLSWWDALDQQDRLVGSGFKVYSDAQVTSIAGQGGGGVDQFAVNIRSERTLPTTGQPPRTLIDDYDVIGTLRVRQAEPVPDPSDPEKDRFVKAVDVFQKVQATMAGLEKDITKAKGDARKALLERLKQTRKFAHQAALRSLKTTRQAYDAKRLAGAADARGLQSHDADAQDRHLCVEPDCCTEHARRIRLNCLATTSFGDAYCTALANYRFDLCKHPNAVRPLAPPTAPAAPE
jgi:hypothetical protein